MGDDTPRKEARTRLSDLSDEQKASLGEETDSLGIRVAATLSPILLFVGILYPLFAYSGELLGVESVLVNGAIVVGTLAIVVYRVGRTGK